jgi:hypothetical protein
LAERPPGPPGFPAKIFLLTTSLHQGNIGL